MDTPEKHILLVEDEEAHIELIRRAFLMRSNPIRLIVARTLNEAKNSIAQSKPSLVITDIHLPDGKGVDLLPAEQKESTYPVVVMSSYGDEEIAVDSMKAGAMDYIVKTSDSLADIPHIAKHTLDQWEFLMEHQRTYAQLQASLREKELLLKEVHHRVKNNLQLITSMLNLQAMQANNVGLTGILDECQARIRTIAMIHEKLYRSDNFELVNFSEYIHLLSNELLHTYRVEPGQICLNLNTSTTYLIIDQAIPCGLIFNELLTNTLKHAFPYGRRGTIDVSFKPGPSDQMIMSITDDGVGIPADLNLDEQKSLGMTLVKALTRQIDGVFSLDRHPKTTFTVKFEIKKIHGEN